MTARTQTNRLQRLACNVDALTAGAHAAIHNEPWNSNPYPPGSFFWMVWAHSFQETLEELATKHEAEFAARMVREGEICAGERIADAHDPQPQSFWNWLFNTKGK